MDDLQQQQQQPDNVQSQVDQGVAGDGQQQAQQQQTQQEIDYEKAYRNLEKEFTRKSQRLKELEDWGKFQETTGISAEQALQQLEMYQQQYQQPPAGQPMTGYPPQQTGYAPESFSPYVYDDPRVSHLEEQLNSLMRERQVEQLRQRFPQFDELYPQVIDLADSQGLDLETAFGKVLVNNWDDFVGQAKKEVVNNIRAKGMKSVETSQAPDDGGSPAANLTEEELTAARLMGVDPNEYAQMKDAKYTID